MFVREKIARGHRYLYLVESVREGGRVRQRTIRALGRKDALHASGELDRLIASLARHSERAMVLSDMEAGRLACTRIGGPLLFGRLWERLGLGAVVNELVEGRGFEFALERAVFVSVLHRLFVSGSDRSCEKWMGDYAIPGIDGLRLHHLYRAMSWLGEEAGAGKAFEIDAGKLADEARFDGIFVLRTNARMTPLNAVLRYRELLQVEDLFRRAKAQLRTRPIYHSRDAAIRGHVFCSFLALVLQKELADRCRAAGVSVEWDDLIRDLDRLQEATIEKDGKRVTTRTHVTGQVGKIFQAAGVALPPNSRERPA